MEAHTPVMDHPKKRRRRRRLDRSPIPATLLPDSDLKSVEVLLSADLSAKLFPRPAIEDQPLYIAVTPWVPNSSTTYQDLPWVVLPVRPATTYDEATPVETIRLSASSSTLKSIFRVKYFGTTAKDNVRSDRGLRVLVLDVEPVQLFSVYVTVDGGALSKHEQIQKEFGGGFGPFRKDNQSDKEKGKFRANALNSVPESSTKNQQAELTEAVRSALSSLPVVGQGELLPLPLPAHPITHVPLPPARIILCQPVNQGLLSKDTKIIVNRRFGADRHSSSKTRGQLWRPSTDSATENGDETSNEQFFSTVEDGITSQDGLDAESRSSSSEGSESNESDDSPISLSTPYLLNQPRSSFTATPRARVNGTSTPGSMFSDFTTSTTLQGPGTGKSFQACSLMAPVPIDLLHPRPSDIEDEEVRVFINVKDLTRLKCFSGDWIKLCPFSPGQSQSWDLSILHSDDRENKCRAVKVYGLPDRILSRSAMNYRTRVPTLDKTNRPTQAWLSPVLLANLGYPSDIRLTPINLSKQPFSPKHIPTQTGRLDPPIATEVSLAKVPTPISQEAVLQDMVFSKLKRYFEDRRRVVKSGDLIGMTIDANIGRILGPASSATEGGQNVLSLLFRSDARSLEVVWFKVGQITTSIEDMDENVWGGAACVDPTTTRMTIGTSHQCKVPHISWQTYLGVAPPSRAASPWSISQKPYVSALQRRLRELIAAATSPRAQGMSPTLILLHSNQRNIGKARVATKAASELGIHTFSIDAYQIISEGNAADVQESSINTRISRALSCGAQYTNLLVRHVEALTTNKVIAVLQQAKVRILIATTTQLDHVPENLRSLFTHEIEMSAPDEREREGILQEIIAEQGIRVAHDVDLSAIAVKTAALVAGNLVDIIERAVIAREIRLENFLPSSPRDLIISGGEWARCVTKDDFDLAVDAARKNFADAIGAPKIPNVSWDDVGGLEHVKDAVMETIQLPLERPELFAKGMKKRSGILFYGPPGTGKTLLAKAIATEFSLNFFSVKGPELLNMYIGESEANVRRVFQRARDAKPCVVFFDELDSVAPKRGNQGDSGGVMDRIVSQLLSELDGMSNGDDIGGGVFVIGATNRPDLLDQALLRPGRFDKMLYLGISDTHQKQLTILEALTRKFTLHPDLSLTRVAESLPFTYTGADLYALCSDAMLKAITKQAEAVDAKIKALPNGPVSHAYFFDHLATNEDVAVMVTEQDFYAAKRELFGSVR